MSNYERPEPARKIFFTRKRKRLFTIVALFLVALLVFFNQPFGASVTRQEAMEIALEHIGGGRANRPDIDWANFQRAWYVEVFYDGLVHSVYISTRTGDVIRVEVDRWD